MNQARALDALTVGIIGCGNMGSAIALGLSRQEEGPDLVLFDVDVAKCQGLAERVGGRGSDSADDLVKSAEIVVVAVKPDAVVPLLGAMAWPSAERLVVSVAAGLPVAKMVAVVPESVAVVRSMPNTPATVGAGVSAFLRHEDPAVNAKVSALLSACGVVVPLDKEGHFDAVTGLSGSGPAYVFVAIEALADGGVNAGLPRDVALALATHTVLGAARLVAESGRHPADLKDAVASPGGTTIRGLAELERGGFRAALVDAVAAAAARSKELSG